MPLQRTGQINIYPAFITTDGKTHVIFTRYTDKYLDNLTEYKWRGEQETQMKVEGYAISGRGRKI